MYVGFIGLGQMGRAIAANVLRAGHKLLVWNRSEAPMRELAALGAATAAEPADAARADVLMSMLADDTVARGVLIGRGVIARMRAGAVHVNLATVSVACARELARLHRERGVDYVAAPVFGRPEVAREAKLNVVVAGEPSAFASIVYQGYGRLIAEGRFEPAGFPMRLGLKDVRLALEAADAAHVPMPSAGVVHDSMLEAIAHGEADLDWAALVRIAMRRAAAGPIEAVHRPYLPISLLL